MTLHAILHYAIFAFLALVTVGSAILVASTRRIIHAAYWLFPVFAGIAGFYLYLDAQFLAIIQILIYIGAILVLIIFAVTLTRDPNTAEERQSNRYVVPVVLSSLVLLVALVGAVMLSPWATPVKSVDGVTIVPGVPVTDVAAVGVTLLQQYLLPFEIASFLLLAAMVGAVVLARKERPEAAKSETVPQETALHEGEQKELAGV